MIQRDNIFVYLVILLLLQACANTGVAPVDQRGEVKESKPGTTQHSSSSRTKTAKKPANQSSAKDGAGYHIVNSGDTLYSIAWRYNQDYKDVAIWNNIASPYTIYPGQLIRLKPAPKPVSKPPLTKKGTPLQIEPAEKNTTPATTKSLPAPKSTTTIKKQPEVAATKTETKPALPNGPIKWSWPTNGKLDKSNSPTSEKGIDIRGNPGQTVKAAAAGDVVYSGSGLLGYGKLIIIKHNETYLSAYAYNSKLLVKEGDRVTAGQAISNMGQDHSGRSVLHFEIRKNGKPVNPIKHLPKIAT